MSAVTSDSDLANRFLALHRPGQPLLLPNPWDIGSARLLASMDFAALATTSSGYAATLGRQDGSVTREEAIAHAAAIAAATPLPVTADLEKGFADDPAGVADTIARLQRYAEAGADVLYAPGLSRASDIRDVVSAVDRPVNVLAFAGAPTVAELADLGVARISVGGAFTFAALGALIEAARELQTEGTYGYLRAARTGRQLSGQVFPA